MSTANSGSASLRKYHEGNPLTATLPDVDVEEL
jgi:hypothetical protein